MDLRRKHTQVITNNLSIYWKNNLAKGVVCLTGQGHIVLIVNQSMWWETCVHAVERDHLPHGPLIRQAG